MPVDLGPGIKNFLSSGDDAASWKISLKKKDGPEGIYTLDAEKPGFLKNFIIKHFSGLAHFFTGTEYRLGNIAQTLKKNTLQTPDEKTLHELYHTFLSIENVKQLKGSSTKNIKEIKEIFKKTHKETVEAKKQKEPEAAGPRPTPPRPASPPKRSPPPPPRPPKTMVHSPSTAEMETSKQIAQALKDVNAGIEYLQKILENIPNMNDISALSYARTHTQWNSGEVLQEMVKGLETLKGNKEEKRLEGQISTLKEQIKTETYKREWKLARVDIEKQKTEVDARIKTIMDDFMTKGASLSLDALRQLSKSTLTDLSKCQIERPPFSNNSKLDEEWLAVKNQYEEKTRQASDEVRSYFEKRKKPS
jgi:hypothetical protein